MPTCNINAKGKAMRLITGSAVSLIAILLALLTLTHILAGNGWWWPVAVTALSGLFMIYEGWAGWCALRAMGIRTKL